MSSACLLSRQCTFWLSTSLPAVSDSSFKSNSKESMEKVLTLSSSCLGHSISPICIVSNQCLAPPNVRTAAEVENLIYVHLSPPAAVLCPHCRSHACLSFFPPPRAPGLHTNQNRYIETGNHLQFSKIKFFNFSKKALHHEHSQTQHTIPNDRQLYGCNNSVKNPKPQTKVTEKVRKEHTKKLVFSINSECPSMDNVSSTHCVPLFET